MRTRCYKCGEEFGTENTHMEWILCFNVEKSREPIKKYFCEVCSAAIYDTIFPGVSDMIIHRTIEDFLRRN